MNRFSTFVTSGAEEWVLKGTAADTVITESSASSHDRMASVISVEAEDDDTGEPGSNRLSQIGMGEADRHFVDASHAWKPKIPVFRVLVHSPSKRTSTLSGAFTVYNVTSLFHPTPEETPEEGLPRSGTPACVAYTNHGAETIFAFCHPAYCIDA